jgi:hypothetical protein
MAWTVTIGQSDDPIGIRTQDRITNIVVTEEFALATFSVTIKNPTAEERAQSTGRVDSAIIRIKRKSDTLIDGFIEDVESGPDYVRYTGRSFLVLLGYSTSSNTSNKGKTDAEFKDKEGTYIIRKLISEYCTKKDGEIYPSVSLKDIHGEPVVYEGNVKLHGKKVYQIVKEMCQSYGHDLYAWGFWWGDRVEYKVIVIGEKTRGYAGTDSDPGEPHKILRGGIHLKSIPIVKYRSSQTINCLRVIGAGTGKDKVSVFVEDQTESPNNSIENNGYIEGEPYHNNMIRSVKTAQSIGEAIISAKKDTIEELHVELAMFISDVKYGDWINIIDPHSNIDTTKRIKKLIQGYSVDRGDTMSIELGDKFDNYQNIIQDLTKGDVDAEPDMTVAGGSLRLTANDPPDSYVRIDPGNWYGTDGLLYNFDATSIRTFWGGDPFTDPPYNPSVVGNYCKALVQIKDGATAIKDIIYKTNLTAEEKIGFSKEVAKIEVVPSEPGYVPIGEIILKCKAEIDGYGSVSDITAIDEGGSFIYRDARPIVGSSVGSAGGRWELISRKGARNIWTASTAYNVGSWIKPTAEPIDRYFLCISSEEPWESGTVEPLWTSTSGSTIVDNNLLWQCQGDGIIVDEILGIPNMDVWVKPVGNGVVYLG